MSNKFELLEKPKVKGDAGHGRQTTRIFRTRNNITHPVQAMVRIYRCMLVVF